MKLKQKLVAIMIFSAIVGAGASAFSVSAASCGGADTAIINCSQTNSEKSAKDSGVWGVLLIALNILTAGVGIAAVGGIVYASILYTSAEENASQIKEAKDIIKNVVIGLVAYGFMYLGLNFLIPGGIFS